MITNNAVPPENMNRRDFLALSILGGLTGLLAACNGGSTNTGNATPTATASKPTPGATPTQQSTPTNADWAALAHSLQGTLVRPGNPQYTTAHQLFSTRFDNILPVAIAYC